MKAFLGTADFSAVLRVCVYAVVCNLEKLGHSFHDATHTQRMVLNLLGYIDFSETLAFA